MDMESQDEEELVVAALDYSSDDDDGAATDAGGDMPVACAEQDNPYDLTPLLLQFAKPTESIGAAASATPTAAWPREVLQSVVDPSYSVERVHFSELSVAAFRARAAACRNPLIVTGLSPHLAPHGLTADILQAVLPADLVVPVRGHPPQRAADFFDGLRRGEPWYLADAPLARHFPWLFQVITTD